MSKTQNVCPYDNPRRPIKGVYTAVLEQTGRRAISQNNSVFLSGNYAKKRKRL